VNDPHDDHEQRIQKLEQDRNDIVESERLLLRLSRYHRAGLQELNGKVERLELLQGDTNERLDKIERLQEEHSKRFDTIEAKQDAHTEVLNKIVDLLEKRTP
jgi:hypothetical protein